MLAKRIILALCLSEGHLTRTKLFRPDRWYPLNIVDQYMADEIVLLDVTRGSGNAIVAHQREKFWAAVLRFSRELFLPLSVGGWIRSMEDVKRAFDSGADKVVINTMVHESPALVVGIAEKYGCQAAVISVDVAGEQVFVEQGRKPTGIGVVDYCRSAVAMGAGEILLMDIARDGSLGGYNLPLVKAVSSAVNVPVIAVGGCGNWSHMVDGFAAGADACATSVIHHLTAKSLQGCKAYLADRGLEMRL